MDKPFHGPLRKGNVMEKYEPYVIKSFKHNGQLHRQWLENWRVPEELLAPEHARESMMVFINFQTKIQESDGAEWTSKVPSVVFFVPGRWYNVVALLEPAGIRYYCNIASPPFVSGHVITYIDYDLDVIRMCDGEVQVVDQEEYERHKLEYHYDEIVQAKVHQGLEHVLDRIGKGAQPFDDGMVKEYFLNWRKYQSEV